MNIDKPAVACQLGLGPADKVGPAGVKERSRRDGVGVGKENHYWRFVGQCPESIFRLSLFVRGHEGATLRDQSGFH
jgi:hypothetical protein